MMSPSSPTKKLQWTKASSKASTSAAPAPPQLSKEEWTHHVYFAGACFVAKTLFRSFLRPIAAKGLSLVNFWYPFLATLACVHHERHPAASDGKPLLGDSSSSSKGHLYWFRYWTLYALAQALDHFLLQLSLVFFQKQSSIALRNQWMAELNLLFTIYLLVIPSATGFCYCMAQPYIAKGYAKVSEAVSKETWNTMVESKASKVLELMVNVHILEPYWKELILSLLKESRTLIVPAALTLLPLTPALFTRLGVVYSQFLLPVGKSCSCQDQKKKKAPQLLHALQYWILHSFVAILFEALRYFWWIPFYDHSMFLFWAYLSFDGTVKQYYNILELDLISLGLLPGDETIKVGVHETQTVQLLTAIAKKIPSADRAELEKLIQQGNGQNHNNGGQHPAVLTSRQVQQQQQGGLQWSQERSQHRVVPVQQQQEREPQDVTNQLKSLIRQLPIEDQEDLDDEKTKQLLEMLMQQLKKEEEKVVLSTDQEGETLSSSSNTNVRLVTHSPTRQEIKDHPPPSSSFSSDSSDVFYESKATSSSRHSLASNMREESFQTAHSTESLEIRPSSSMNTMSTSMNTISTSSDSQHNNRYAIDEEEEEETTTNKTRVSTLDAVVVDSNSNNNTTKEKNAPSPGRLAMSERRLKREKVRTPKPAQGSLVSRFVGSLENKHKARRKDKREKLLEKKKLERLKKSS
mmetsp:Transcript_15195/g.37288  ORF Transcript_15195/g.37288 Transcript_15195/m.37288 type:complete len:691 (+) Transcript_15195:307-2379(+)